MKNHSNKIVLIFILLLALPLHSEFQYVSKTGSAQPPYTNCITASDSIQKRINISSFGDTIYEGNGTYTEYNKKPTTEILQDGDNIIIPENKLNEFLKNYKPKQNQKLNKTTNITLDGYINDALTKEPILNVETTLYIYDGATPIDTLGPVFTNSQGYYSFTITGIEDQKQITNIGQIEYFNGNTRITTNNNKKIKIITYDILGQEITVITHKEIQGTETINLKLKQGQTITKIEIDNKTYTNIHINDRKNHYIKKGKNIEQITEETTKQPQLKKTTTIEEIMTLGGVIDLVPPNNQHHRYFSGIGEFNENTQFNFSLVPRINLENQITDPEYTTIPTIKTIRDLWWYAARVQGEWDNKANTPMLYPIKLHIDTTNAPNGWKEEIRNVITYYQDSLEIHPDSLIKENQTYKEPAFNNGFSAINIIYTDSTTIGEAYGVLGTIYSSSNNTIIGAWIKINVPKINNKEDAGMIIARQIQKYITQTPYQIKNPQYLGNTTNTELGTTRRPNNDEKKLIKIGRNRNKPTYINGIYP